MTLPDDLATDGPLDLAAGFDPVDDDTWADTVRAATRGRGPETLVRTTLDGIEVAPLYVGPAPDPGLPGASPHVRGRTATRRGWDVHVRVGADRVGGGGAPDAATAAARLLADVEGGADGAIVGPSIAARDLAQVLGPVLDRLRVVTLRPRHDAVAAAQVLLSLRREAGTEGPALGLGVDPVGLLAATGWIGEDPDATLAHAATLVSGGDGSGVTWTLTLDGTPWSSAGGADAEVLGLVTAQVVHAVRCLLRAGVDADVAVDQVQVLLPLDADQFAGICALRALRRLVDRVATLAGASPGHRAVRTDVVMAPRVLTRHDPWVNLLRGTVVAFVAGVAGADGVLVLPHDGTGDPSALGRRLARTTPLVLREESHLARADDPAGGSWYVEARTEALAEAAWEVVREVDRRGGPVAALADGWVAELLARTRERRDRDLATRASALTGVSTFPDLDETALPRVPVDVTHDPAAVPADAVRVSALPVTRFADAFEALRDASDAYRAASGDRPRIFLATLGPLAEHTARTEFARDVFAAGGIAAVLPEETAADPATVVADLVTAFVASGTDLACVTGTDARYAEHAAPLVRALREAGATRVHLAGRTPDPTPDDDRPDADVHVGCDVVAVLRAAHAVLDRSAPLTRGDLDATATTEAR